MLYSYRILALALSICTSLLLGIYANNEHLVLEVLLRKAVIDEVRSIPSCVQKWGSEIEKLKRGLKEGLRTAGHLVTRANMEKISPGLEMVDAVSNHLCESGRFTDSLSNEIKWYNERKSYVLSPEMPQSSLVQDFSEGETTLLAPEDSNSSPTMQAFYTNPLVSFLVGTVVGACLAHYILLLKFDSDKNIGVKLRRPEL
ncbi:unnamed protein product [Bathycoccus prasinos]